MKSLVLFISSAFFLSALSAQTVKTEKWSSGQTKSTGAYKYDVPAASANATKQEILRISSQLVKVGKWQYWFENGQMQAEESYTDGLRTGSQKSWYSNGTHESVVDLDAKTATYWFDNGQKQSEGAVLSNAAPTGRWISWHSNGVKNSEGAYDLAGLKQGTWQFWNAQGQLIGQQTYRNGIAQN